MTNQSNHHVAGRLLGAIAFWFGVAVAGIGIGAFKEFVSPAGPGYEQGLATFVIIVGVTCALGAIGFLIADPHEPDSRHGAIQMRSITAVVLTSLLVFAGCARQTSEVQNDATLKDLAIQHVTDTSGQIFGPSHFVIETFDRRTQTIAVTGMFRTPGEDNARVGRFWVELQLDGSSWTPKLIAATSQPFLNAEQMRWP